MAGVGVECGGLMALVSVKGRGSLVNVEGFSDLSLEPLIFVSP